MRMSSPDQQVEAGGTQRQRCLGIHENRLKWTLKMNRHPVPTLWMRRSQPTDRTVPQWFSPRTTRWKAPNCLWLSLRVKCTSTMGVRVAAASSCVGTRSKRASSVSWLCRRHCPRSRRCFWKRRMKCGKRKWKLNCLCFRSKLGGSTRSSIVYSVTSCVLMRKPRLITRMKRWTDFKVCFNICKVKVNLFVPLWF